MSKLNVFTDDDSYRFDCESCDFFASSSPSARHKAKKHHDETGHRVYGEALRIYTWDRQPDVQKQEDLK